MHLNVALMLQVVTHQKGLTLLLHAALTVRATLGRLVCPCKTPLLIACHMIQQQLCCANVQLLWLVQAP